VRPLWERAVEESAKRSRREAREFERDKREARRTCPCCGEESYECDGRLVTEERWDLEFEPSPCRPVHMGLDVAIVLPNGRMLRFNAAYLQIALDAARELGGLEGMFARGDDTVPAVFAGRGWFVVLMPLRSDMVEAEADAVVWEEECLGREPREEGGPAAARQDGDAAEAVRKGGEG
jgi:hypothetical protein